MTIGFWLCEKCGKKTCGKCCEDEHTNASSEAKPHDWWRVEVKLYDGTLLAIEPEMLAGKSDLTDRDLETIRAAGRHLLGFAGT